MYSLDFEPRDYQKPILKTLINNFKENGYLRGILQAKPGTGKTFMAIFLGQMFKKPLIIVPKDILADQWKKEFLNFTDLNEEDIQIIEGSKLNKIDLTKKVFIAKVQSLLSQIKRISTDELQDFYKEFDFIVFDEAHGAGAEGYSKTLSLFLTPNILGLTASPFRKGINEFLLKTSIGEVLIEAKADVLVPQIFIRILPDNYIQFTEKELFALRQRIQEYPMFLALYNAYLLNKKNYFKHITEWVKWAYDQDRDIIILFSTNKLAKKQLKEIVETFPELEKDCLMLTGNSKNDALTIAKQENKKLREDLRKFKEELNQRVKNKELKRKKADEIYKQEREKIKELQDFNIKKALDLYNKKIKESKIIISNFNLLREGFDKSSLSFAIFGSPVIGKITVTQTLGRITRISENKPQPIALFLLTETFIKFVRGVDRIIINNSKLTYPNAIIKKI